MIHILKWIWSYNNYLIRSLTERPTNTSHRIGQFSALQKNISPIAIALERESGISRDLVHLSSYYSYAITCWLATMILIFIWAVLVLDVENCISGIEFLVWQSHVLVASIHRYFSNDQLRQIKLQKYEERRVVIIDNKQEKKKKKRCLHFECSNLERGMQAQGIHESSHFLEALISSPAKRKHITYNSTGLLASVKKKTIVSFLLYHVKIIFIIESILSRPLRQFTFVFRFIIRFFIRFIIRLNP